MVPKREAELKSALFAELERQLPRFYTLLYATAAAPDRSIVGGGRQTNWEFKHCTPSFVSHGNQELMCMRLAEAGYCRYVMWWESATGVGQRTMVVHPRAVHDRSLVPEAWAAGFDHQWLVKFIKQVHCG